MYACPSRPRSSVCGQTIDAIIRNSVYYDVPGHIVLDVQVLADDIIIRKCDLIDQISSLDNADSEKIIELYKEFVDNI